MGENTIDLHGMAAPQLQKKIEPILFDARGSDLAACWLKQPTETLGEIYIGQGAYFIVRIKEQLQEIQWKSRNKC